MHYDEACRLLMALYPEHRERAALGARLLRRLVDGEPIGRLLAEVDPVSAPTEPPGPFAPDDEPMPETLPAGPAGRPGRP